MDDDEMIRLIKWGPEGGQQVVEPIENLNIATIDKLDVFLDEVEAFSIKFFRMPKSEYLSSLTPRGEEET